MTARNDLEQGLSRREPTTTVAAGILELGLELPPKISLELVRLAGARRLYHWSADDFDVVVGAERQLQIFEALFPDIDIDADASTTDPLYLRQLVGNALALVTPDATSAIGALARGRHSHAVRKRLRFLHRLEGKAGRIASGLDLRHAQMQAKSRLAYRVNTSDGLSLAFCAYLAARANRRSIFQIGAQSRAQDTLSEALFQLLLDSDTTDWYAVAMVRPTRDVIERCKPEPRGELVGLFHGEMARWAERLSQLWPSLPERMRDEMVMVKGVDSSRWNAFAGALNTMRSAWISATLACELDEALDSYLPGKAPRLMASDVAWMYRNSGQDLHEDTRMFAALPKPWEVVLGSASQGRDDILAAARTLSVNAQASGWVGMRHPSPLERPAPEPTLVHGVVVSDPLLAASLRRCGVFSGKRLKHLEDMPEIERGVEVTENGTTIPTAHAAGRW